MKAFPQFLLCAALLGIPAAPRAYDVELDAGARIGSTPPSAVGAFSWSAANIAGAFAFGAAADGELSLDADGNPGIDATVTGDASYARGPLVSGLRLEAAALRSVPTGEESVDLSLSAPLTLNGRVFSFSFAPVAGIGFYDDESVRFGAEAKASYLAGDFVLKPGASVSQTVSSDGTRTLEFAPSVGFAWYPGIPVSLDVSVGWSRSLTDGGETTSYPVSAAFSAVPLPWLCVTAKYESEGDVSGLYSYRADAGIELIKYGTGGTAFHLPLAAYYSWSADGDDVFGVSVMVGCSFGRE